MQAKFTIVPAETADDLRAVAVLFADYAASLPVDLDYQDFAAELAGLPGKYAPPRGRLLLARGDDGAALGCVGLRPIDLPDCCEMKRLYSLPAARGGGVGLALTERAITEARRLGYRELRLDTLESMQAAQALYTRIGFVRIAPYYQPTPSGTVFMALAL